MLVQSNLLQPDKWKASRPTNLPETNEEFMQEVEKLMARVDSSISPEQRTKLKELIIRNKDRFCKTLRQPGSAKHVPHKIDTQGHPPIRKRPYRVPKKEEYWLQNEIRQMQRDQIVRRSRSPWAAPVVLVPKKDGTIRFCVDYRALNAITKKIYPLPRIEDILDRLGNAKYFSTLDLASGYWQVPVAEEDKEKTAFITPFGLWEWNVVPMGLTNAPPSFQRDMDVILSGLSGISCLIYIDDIIIFSKTFEEHLQHLQQVFDRIQQAEMFVKITKCHLCRKEVLYLGHVVSAEGVKPDPMKVKVLEDMKAPTNVAELRRFLGLASYYRRFIRGFADIAEPLHRLTGSRVEWTWNEEHRAAFETLKKRLITPPVLAYPNFDKPFILQCDASAVALGGILAQEDNNGNERVIAYASKVLTPAEGLKGG